MKRKRLADRDPLTRKLAKYRWHLKHNGHIPEIKAQMQEKIEEITNQFNSDNQHL